MLIPPFWRGRGNHAPAGIRLNRFRAVVKAAQGFDAYRVHLQAAHLGTTAQVHAVRDVDLALAGVPTLPYQSYLSLFRQRREYRQTPNSQLIRYQMARAGLDSCHSPLDAAIATADLLRLAQAVDSPPDQAVAAFTGMGAGILTNAQRDHLWNVYQVPLFEQFLGTDGRVIAIECVVHSGLHIRQDAAVLQCVDGEIILTSLTDEDAPALRLSTGLAGTIETEVCDCGRTEPRLVGLHRMPAERAVSTVA
jgi:hypothetical protein